MSTFVHIEDLCDPGIKITCVHCGKEITLDQVGECFHYRGNRMNNPSYRMRDDEPTGDKRWLACKSCKPGSCREGRKKLAYNRPPPRKMPDVVVLACFDPVYQVQEEAGLRSWQLVGNGLAWHLSHKRPHQSDLLAWLHRNGYAPISGTSPPAFCRNAQGKTKDEIKSELKAGQEQAKALAAAEKRQNIEQSVGEMFSGSGWALWGHLLADVDFEMN